MEGEITTSVAYGLEWTGKRITLVRASRRKGSVACEVLARGMAPEEASWQALADDVRRAQESGKAVVVTSAPAQDCFVRSIEVPFASPGKARAVLPSLLDVQLPFPLEQCTYRFIQAGKTAAEKVQALALAMPLNRLERVLSETRLILVDPEVVEPEALVLWRYHATRRKIASERPRVVVHLGADRTTVVVGLNRFPMATLGTRMPWGADAGSEEREKLLQRMQQFLAGALRETSVAPEYIISGAAAGTADDLRKGLGVEPESWRVADEPDTLLARALAEGGLDPGSWPGNLRIGELEHPHVRRYREKVGHRALAMIAASAVALIIASAVSVRMAKAGHDRLQAKIAQEAKVLSGQSFIPRGQEVSVVRKAMSENPPTELEQFVTPSGLPRFAGLLKAAADKGIALEVLSVREGAVLVRGTCVTWDDPDALVRVLTGQDWNVEEDLREDAGQDERVHFTMRARP